MTTQRFIENSKRMGSFWALYLMGIRSPLDIKMTLLILTLQMVCGLVVVYQTNRLLLSQEIDTHELMTTVVIVCLEQPINAMINMWLSPRSNSERLKISERIVKWVVHVFDRSTYEWRHENPETVQIEAMDHIFNTFYGITWNIADIITSSVSIMSFVVMAFFNSWIVGLVVVLGSVTISLCRRHFNADLERVNSEMGDRAKAVRLATSNRHINRSDHAVNHVMQTLMNPSQYNPINGLVESISIWDQRDGLSRYSKLIDRATKAVVLISVCFFIIYDKKMVVWILLNGHKLFGFTDIISRIDDIRTLMGGRIAPHLKIIEALKLEDSLQVKIRIDDNDQLVSDDDEKHLLLSAREDDPPVYTPKDDLQANTFKDDPRVFTLKDYPQVPTLKEYPPVPTSKDDPPIYTPSRKTHPRVPIGSPDQLDSISIDRIEWKSGSHSLSLQCPIVIDLSKAGIIMFEGKKGCGKSVSLDIFAGLYDGSVAFRMRVNGRLVEDEFKNPIFLRNRLYIQQLVSDRYRRNQKGTIIMTLRELFPGATYDMIHSWLLPFDMVKKMPPRSFDAPFAPFAPFALDIPVGKNERSFSPGELQAMVLASLLWKACHLKIQFLLLDEPERNIDFETIKNIFDKVIGPMIAKYRITVVMVTHNPKLKAMLKRGNLVKQTFHFHAEGSVMTFGT